MDSQAGLVRVVLAIGDVCLTEVSLDCVTSGSRIGVIEVAPSSDTAVMQAVVPVQTAAVMLTLRGATTKTPVIKLSVSTAVGQVPLSWPAQAGVAVVTGPTTPKTQVVDVKVEVAALRAGECHKAAFCVTTAQVVVIACRCVRGGA